MQRQRRLSAQPLLHDFFHGIAFECFVREKFVDDRRERGPMIVAIEETVEFDGRLLQVCQAFPFLRKKSRGCFPGLMPIRGPLRDETRMVRFTAMNHFGDRTSEGDQDGLLQKLAVGVSMERPLHADLRVPFRAVVSIGVDRDRADAGADVDRHERMTGLMIGRDLAQISDLPFLVPNCRYRHRSDWIPFSIGTRAFRIQIDAKFIDQAFLCILRLFSITVCVVWDEAAFKTTIG
jgi:hypothetical protein